MTGNVLQQDMVHITALPLGMSLVKPSHDLVSIPTHQQLERVLPMEALEQLHKLREEV
jgi:hypothetical protein